MNLSEVSVWWNTLFVAVLQRSLGALWLIPAVLVLRLVLKRSPKWISCLLWVLVAVELVCPVRISSPLSVRNVTSKAAPVELRYTDRIDKPELFVDFPAVPGYLDRPHIGTAKQNVHTSDFYIPPLRNLWMAGTVLMLTYGTLSTLCLRRRVAAALHTEDHVWICDDIDTPFVLGVVCPRIYLPSTLGEREQTSVLAHERAHLQRRDHWWKLLGFLILAAYWFHPLVWLSYLLLGRDIELACDEKVCRELSDAERKMYAQALLSLSVSKSVMPANPLGFGEIGVKERVKNVAKYKKPAMIVTVLALALVALVGVAFGTTEKKAEPLEVSYQAITLNQLQTEFLLSAQGGKGDYVWNSDDPSVAMVDKTGRVEGKAAGTTVIHCTSGDGQSAECKVTVQDNEAEEPELQASEVASEQGSDNAQLAAEFAPYGVTYNEANDHVMHDGQIVSYIERIIDTTDSLTPPEHPDEEKNADPEGTVILRFIIDETEMAEDEENAEIRYKNLVIFDAKTHEILHNYELAKGDAVEEPEGKPESESAVASEDSIESSDTINAQEA